MTNKTFILLFSILFLFFSMACTGLTVAEQPAVAVPQIDVEVGSEPAAPPTPTLAPTAVPVTEPEVAAPAVEAEPVVAEAVEPETAVAETTPSASSDPAAAQEVVQQPQPMPTHPAAAGATPIQFEAGRTFGNVQGQLSGFEADVYSFVAREGQLVLAVVEGSAGNLSVEIARPQGTLFGAQFNFWRGILPSSGEYLLKVVSDVANATYNVTLYIEDFGTERVSFAHGVSSAQLTGWLADNSIAAYTLRAGAGQVMSLNLTASSHKLQIASIYQLFPSGKLFEVAAVSGRSYLGTLPADGDYIVVVSAGIPGGDYTLDVAITE